MRRRDLVIGALLVAIFASVALGWGRADNYSGVHFAYRDGQVVVASTDYGSWAYSNWVFDGWIVETLGDNGNETDVLGATPEQKQAIASESWHWNEMYLIGPASLEDELAARAQLKSDGTERCYTTFYYDSATGGYYITYPKDPVTGQPLYQVEPSTGEPTGADCVAMAASYDTWYGFWPNDEQGDYFLLLAILAGTLAGIWWLGTGREGRNLVAYAWTLPVATAMPLLAMRLDNIHTAAALIVQGVIVVGGLLPLGLQLAGGLRRGLAQAVVAAMLMLSVFTLVVCFGAAGMSRGGGELWLRFLAPAGIVLLPGLLRAWRGRRPAVDEAGREDLRPTEALAITLTVVSSCCALLSPGRDTWLILLWLSAVAVWRLGRLPMSRLLSRTTKQRDLVVKAAESERARIAADIHDYALQDLTLLVRRLDASGDTANASVAREVADRLRSICGDLRLPVLDDLGLGPALEWLCGRYEPPIGPISLDRDPDEPRLPAEQELAFFRVAQEAIANAARHGAPPICVRYRGGGTWAEIEVDDSGPGIPPGAADRAERTGHLGLMTMSQRAESIGGTLSLARRPGGGSRVRLVWDPEAQARPDDGGRQRNGLGRLAATALARSRAVLFAAMGKGEASSQEFR
jgi:signal transduction histidine kinase